MCSDFVQCNEGVKIYYTGPIISRQEANKKGLKRYFTGKACCNGHVAERRVSSPGCIKCENVRKLYKSNKESVKLGKIGARLRTRISGAIRRYNKTTDKILIKRQASAKCDLGCTIEWFYKEYFPSKFQDGMTWDNYGKEWEIDHIKPIALFDLYDPEEQKKAIHYTNLQPLWKHDHKKKTAKDINHIKRKKK